MQCKKRQISGMQAVYYCVCYLVLPIIICLLNKLKPTCFAKFCLQATTDVSRSFSSLTLVILLAIAVMFHKSSMLTVRLHVNIQKGNLPLHLNTWSRQYYLLANFHMPEKSIILFLFRTQCQNECRF